jgi:4-amino-4-deoxy-L-arabinose transferase-like glycosyltransferase
VNERRRWLRSTALALILATFPLMIFSRLRLRETPLERDEGEYAYAGQLILQGIPPYSLACNMKLPGTYAAYAAIMAVFGQTIGGIRLGLLLMNAATALLLYLLGRRLFSKVVGLAAAAAYALLSFGLAVMGTAAHATHFVVFFALAGLVLLLRAMDSDRAATFFWSGVLFGIAFLMKQHGMFFAAFGAAWLIWKHPGGWMRTARRLALFGVAAALPFALTCIILWMAGVFPKFWFWTFQYARAYASENSLSDAWDNLKSELP